MKAKDGKMRLTDVMNREQLLRLVQSIPSPKVEHLKLWLATVGAERLEETEDPELALFRSLDRTVSEYRSQANPIYGLPSALRVSSPASVSLKLCMMPFLMPMAQSMPKAPTSSTKVFGNAQPHNCAMI